MYCTSCVEEEFENIGWRLDNNYMTSSQNLHYIYPFCSVHIMYALH